MSGLLEGYKWNFRSCIFLRYLEIRAGGRGARPDGGGGPGAPDARLRLYHAQIISPPHDVTAKLPVIPRS